MKKLKYNADEKERLDKFLVQELGLSRTKVQKLIKDGSVTVNVKTPTVHEFLTKGDVIEIKSMEAAKKAVSKTIKPNPKVPFKVIAKTEDYLIIEKPAHVIVHPTEKMEDDTLVSGLIAKFPELKKIGESKFRPAIIHRLDKEVSGLMIVPRNQKAFIYLKQQLKDRKVRKIYMALVHGNFDRSEGTIDLRIGRSRKKGKMAAYPVDAEGAKEALTSFIVRKTFDNLTLLDVSILTGRTHQIRVHFNAMNHPVVGDKLYTQKFVKRKNIKLDRLFLHASELEFTNLKGKKVHYESPMPKELKDLLKKI